MHKLVLIVPPSPWLISDTDLPSLGILYISSYIKSHGYEVDVCDLSGMEEKDWKIPIGDVYGITGTSPNFPQIEKIAELLRSRDNKSIIVVGGSHATTLPEHILNNTHADICVIGEGEETMLEIMQNVNRWNFDSSLHVRGTQYKRSIAIIKNGPRPLIKHLDSLPFPDVSSIDFYRYMPSKTFKYILGSCRESTIIMSRGCTFNCSFCASSTIWKRTVRCRDPKEVVREMDYMHDKYDIKLFYFVDDTFAINKSKIVDLCQELSSKKYYRWHCLNRVDCCSDEIISLMKKSGCVGMVFGFESGSNEILEKVNKKVTVSQMYEAIKIVKKHDLKIRGQLIVGLPGETEQTVEETANFIRNAREVDAFGIHLFQPFPGCDVWNNPLKYNYEIDYDTDFSDYHTIGKPDEELTSNKFLSDSIDYLRSVAADRNIEYKGALE
jgi:radical SAM superfamily enzyme YgiQ (UPF0313 family)